jgi:hypothetical protein
MMHFTFQATDSSSSPITLDPTRCSQKQEAYMPKERIGSFSFQNKENTINHAGLTFQFNSGTKTLQPAIQPINNHTAKKEITSAEPVASTCQRDVLVEGPAPFRTLSQNMKCFVLDTRPSKKPGVADKVTHAAKNEPINTQVRHQQSAFSPIGLIT